MRIRSLLALVAVSLVLTVGCAGKADVTGNVTYKGKPVVWGTVTLLDSSGAAHQGQIDLSGNFAIPAVPSGPVKIGVHSTNPDTGRPSQPRDVSGRGTVGSRGGADDPRAKFTPAPTTEQPRPEPGKWFPLPDTASDPMTSNITGVVQKGKPLNINIE